MNHSPYEYKQHLITRYSFTSIGWRRIEKVVDFSETVIKDTFNLAFGDLKTDGTVDDITVSNNGDIIKVLSTVIYIIKDFTACYPNAIISFLGSSPDRMKLYTRILRTYYPFFSKEFSINAFILSGDMPEEVEFTPEKGHEYMLFLIKRIN